MTIRPRTLPTSAPRASAFLNSVTAKAFACLFALGTVLGLQLAVVPDAHAHDVLVEQTPAPGETFAEAPDEIVLTFNNRPIDMGPDANQIRVTDSEGNVAIDHQVEIVDMNAVLSLDGLKDGAYHTVWQVVSSDGHSISGAFTFAVGANAEADLAALPSLEETLNQGGAASGNDDIAEDATDDAGGASLPMIITVSVVAVAAAVLVFVMMWRKSQQKR